MREPITIIDKDYTQWVKDLVIRYRKCQIKAAIQVNTEQLHFIWLLGHDIVEMKVEERWGEGVIAQLSNDLRKAMPHVEGLSVTNLRYCRRFYLLYSPLESIQPQLGGETTSDTNNTIHPQAEGELQVPDHQNGTSNIFNIPWGHHKLILDRVKGKHIHTFTH